MKWGTVFPQAEDFLSTISPVITLGVFELSDASHTTSGNFLFGTRASLMSHQISVATYNLTYLIVLTVHTYSNAYLENLWENSFPVVGK